MITLRPEQLKAELTKRMGNDYRKIHQALFNAVLWGEQKAVSLTNEYNKVDLGEFKKKWKAKKTAKGAELRNSSSYAAIIEYGRTPGKKMPPVDKIEAWMQRKGMEGSAYMLAKAIGERGSPPPGTQPVRILNKTTKMILDRLPTEVRKAVSVNTYADVK